MANNAWYDIEMRSRRMEKICKDMITEYENYREKQPELALSFLHTWIKIETNIKPYLEQFLGLQKFLKEHGKDKTDKVLV